MDKKIPKDQQTKVKPASALEIAEGNVEKVKTTSIADFRRALTIGKKNLDKFSKFNGKDQITICIMGADGNKSDMTLEYNIKPFNAGDWVKYSEMQSKTGEGGKEEKAMSNYAAAVIIGCVDDEGARIFSPEHVKLLDHHSNALAVMNATNSILIGAGATGDQDAVEKPV